MSIVPVVSRVECKNVAISGPGWSNAVIALSSREVLGKLIVLFT